MSGWIGEMQHALTVIAIGLVLGGLLAVTMYQVRNPGDDPIANKMSRGALHGWILAVPVLVLAALLWLVIQVAARLLS